MSAARWLIVALVLMWGLPCLQSASAQEVAADLPELPPDVREQFDLYLAMGMEEEPALLMAVMGADGTGITPLMLMMMLDDAGADEEALLGMMMMQSMGQGAQAAQPVVLDRGERLIIVDGGRVSVVNLETMQVEGTVRYRGDHGGLAASILAPVFARAREKAQTSACLSNVKQICLGLLMYAQDYDEVLVAQGLDWVEGVYPYVMNDQILRCPSRPALPVGYALDERLIGASLAQLPRPAETIIVFESNLGGENPVGGPDDIPPDGVHNGGIVCGFVDGHAKWLPVDDARALMMRDPFE